MIDEKMWPIEDALSFGEQHMRPVDDACLLFASDFAALDDRLHRRKRRKTSALLDALHEENVELRIENTNLNKQNARLSDDNDALRTINASLLERQAVHEDTERWLDFATEKCREMERRCETISRNYRELQQQYARLLERWSGGEQRVSIAQTPSLSTLSAAQSLLRLENSKNTDSLLPLPVTPPLSSSRQKLQTTLQTTPSLERLS